MGANGQPAPLRSGRAGDGGSIPPASTRLLYLIERYRRARIDGTRAQQHEARARLFDAAQEVMDGRPTDAAVAPGAVHPEP